MINLAKKVQVTKRKRNIREVIAAVVQVVAQRGESIGPRSLNRGILVSDGVAVMMTGIGSIGEVAVQRIREVVVTPVEVGIHILIGMIKISIKGIRKTSIIMTIKGVHLHIEDPLNYQKNIDQVDLLVLRVKHLVKK